MKRTSAEDLMRMKALELGLNPEQHLLTSREGIACALRRAAGYKSPCSSATLIRSVVAPFDGLVPDLEPMRELVEDVLEGVIANGDILEEEDFLANPGATGTLLFAAPPSFVVRKSGSVLVLGIAPDHQTPLPSEMEEQLQYVGHTRRLVGPEPALVRQTLRDYGLVELTLDYWLRMPPVSTAERLVSNSDELLDRAPIFNADVPGLMILDSEEPIRYYRGRWKEPKKQSGRYIGRRKQAYGADLWCYIELVDGKAQRLVDFPIGRSRHRGCDHAWHLQMAIDAVSGKPQEYLVEARGSGDVLVRFYSPVPQWAQRRLSAVGAPEEARGCLIAYVIPANEIDEERAFWGSGLWMMEQLAKQGG